MNRLPLLFVLALPFLTLFHSASGEEKVFTDLNCAITIPDDWTEITLQMQFPGIVTAYAKPDQTGVIFLTANKQPANSEILNDKFIADFEAGITDSGGTKLVDGKIVEMAGLKSYLRIGALAKDGQQLSTKTLAIPTQDYFYSINTIRFNGLATEDPELEKVISGFRFLTTPQAPVEKSEAYQAGYKIGYFIGRYLIAIIIGFIMLATVVGLVVIAVHRKKSRRRRSHRSHSH